MSSGNETLASTSALVLLWGGAEIHKSKLSQNYRKLIDLNSGRKLIAKCNKVWDHYDQVIKNRKNCILNIVNNVLSNNDMQQVVILGAGLDSLSLEIWSHFNSVRIFEVDNSNMEFKKNIIDEIDPSLSGHIKHITFDLSLPKELLNSMKNYGFQRTKPTLVVAEGFSYYMDEKKFWNIMEKFQTPNKQNNIILEYLIPQKMISENRVVIPNKIFKIIGSEFGLESITHYFKEEIQNKILNLNGKIIANYNLKQMERQRTNENQYFKNDKSGWIEVCHAVI
ncbi:MAG TPA: class I SAM-dependent methyltransferase [Nitrosopumilaceae archaeon]|jgi:methyltransferase (TIGR00027 family)|nr:class I SAM-dependent methyltransferase [Nitrosopumilaceae archaeon]